MNFISRRNIQTLISYHSAALGIFPGGFPCDEDSARLAQSIADVTSYPFPPIDTGCPYSGTLADYAVSTGIAAVDLELTNLFDTDFNRNLQALHVLLNFAPSPALGLYGLSPSPSFAPFGCASQRVLREGRL
jgi:hypothetical protein